MPKIYGQLCCDECDALVTDRDLADDTAVHHQTDLDGDVWETLCRRCYAHAHLKGLHLAIKMCGETPELVAARTAALAAVMALEVAHG